MTVYFHGNFGLNRSRMASLLKRALEYPDLKDKELAEPFGYGGPYAAKYRSWLHKTGIAELSFPLRLTPMGTIVYENDPEFETLTTQWFMHWELTQDPTRAESWHFFINTFLPQHQTFTREYLLEGIMMKLRAHSEKHFGPESKLNPVIVRKLIECYTADYALGNLGIVKQANSAYVCNQSLEELGPWFSKSKLVKAYE